MHVRYHHAPMRPIMAALLLLVTCSCASPADAYVAADRATFDAVAPAHRRYVEADPTLDDAQKARRLAVLATWALRIEHAGGPK